MKLRTIPPTNNTKSMKKATNNYDWINTPPTEDELLTNDDGSEYIPIGIVEKKLYRLDTHWGTENFKFQLWVGKSGAMWAEGSLEVCLSYGGRFRRLVGAATMIVPADTDFDNPAVNSNFSATLKSEAIKNGVKAIGLSFGAGLNDRLTINTPQQNKSVNGRKKPDPVEMKPDSKIQEQYNFAVESLNQKAMDVLKQVYPQIQYTGTKKIFPEDQLKYNQC